MSTSTSYLNCNWPLTSQPLRASAIFTTTSRQPNSSHTNVESANLPDYNSVIIHNQRKICSQQSQSSDATWIQFNSPSHMQLSQWWYCNITQGICQSNIFLNSITFILLKLGNIHSFEAMSLKLTLYQGSTIRFCIHWPGGQWILKVTGPNFFCRNRHLFL